MYRVSNFVTRFALGLLAGALIATFWANLAPQGYADFVELRLSDNAYIGYPNPDSTLAFGRTLTLGYLAGEALMSLFFLYIGKEVWEALVLKNGALRGKKAIAPLVTALTAAAIPALIYALLAPFVSLPDLPTTFAGWPIPVAGDVALSYVIARMVLGPGHPALRFLLLVTIADDILGLLLTGIAYPAGELHLLWLLLPLAAAVLAYVVLNWLPRWLDGSDPLRPASSFMRHRVGLWPYAFAAIVSWWGTEQAGMMPALGLLPIIPAIPHADRAFGVFSAAEEMLADPLNRIAHHLVWPVTAVLFLFGLTHGGVALTAADTVTAAVAVALMAGKPLGFVLGARIARRVFRRDLPAGMSRADLLTVGFAAAGGFTVPLFAIGATLPDGVLQDGARLGLVVSLIFAAVSARVIRTVSRGSEDNA
ncbi:MAG: Na+/H+ antiporter NhaA [Paracoccaceae bacterium]|nr:Na+/H+ antiporter NhaA [Paracoccaceae bacterium]MDE3237768.1 Na+/H+ antiporter NhaA [Paracoccaceae bacterium]